MLRWWCSTMCSRGAVMRWCTSERRTVTRRRRSVPQWRSTVPWWRGPAAGRTGAISWWWAFSPFMLIVVVFEQSFCAVEQF